MNKHTITLRVNDLEYSYLQKLIELRNSTLNEEDWFKYTQSDILRIALGYMIDIELWESKTVTVNHEIATTQMEYAKAYWEASKKSD